MVGCSGGADSCVLLAACAAIGSRSSPPAPIVAVHVHHHLREDADADAAHVEALAASLGAGFLRRDVHPARGPTGLAAAARALRHEALRDAALQCGARHVALAHHADDRLETLLMSLGRGAGVRGLGSIPWVRAAAPRSPVRVVRPMLALSRAEIEECARAIGMRWRDDAGNLDPRSARGLLRTAVVPALRSRWPRIAQRASAAADAARSAGRVARAWARSRTAASPPSRADLRRCGAGTACLLVDAWLRRQGVRAPWGAVVRIARVAADGGSAPRRLRVGRMGWVRVGARTLGYEPGTGAGAAG